MEILWQVLYYFWITGEIIIAISTRRRGSPGNNQDRGTQLALWIAIVLSMTAAEFLRALLPASFHWHQPWIRPAALVLLATGLAIRITAILNLGRWFTANVVTRPGQRLKNTGLYRFVRHPSYLGLEIIFLAAALHNSTWPGLLVAFLPPTIALLYRIHVEEIALAAAFGAEYDQYRRTTKRLIPGLY